MKGLSKSRRGRLETMGWLDRLVEHKRLERSEGKSYRWRRDSEDIQRERMRIARYDGHVLEMDNAPRAQLRATLFCSVIRASLRGSTAWPSTKLALHPPSRII